MSRIVLILSTFTLLGLQVQAQETPYDQWHWFGDSEAYTEGPLNGRNGWEIVQGHPKVTLDPYGHVQLEIPSGSDPKTHVQLNMAAPVVDQLVTVTLNMDMANVPNAPITPVARVFGVELGRRESIELPDDLLLYVSYDGDEWIEVEGSESSKFILRFDRREGRSVFDVASSPGNYLLVNLPIPEGESPVVEFLGHPEHASYVEHVHISTAKGLFIYDQDDDGLTDSWEESFGLSSEEDSRDGDLDGDGVTNVEEFFYRSDPDAWDSDFDGITDYDEIMQGTDPSLGRWPSLGDGRIPFDRPLDEDVVNGQYFLYAPPQDLTAPLEQRIAVLDAIQNYYSLYGDAGRTSAFDDFLEQFPESPYRPWLEAVLAQSHMEAGDWLLAKPLYQKVWSEIRSIDQRERWDPYTFTKIAIDLATLYAVEANWSEVEAILLLIPFGWEQPGLARSYYSLVNAYSVINTDGKAVGIQTFQGALILLFLELKVDQVGKNNFFNGPWDLDRLSLSEIKERAEANGIGLEVAYRESGSEIIFPSVSLNSMGHFTYIGYHSDEERYEIRLPLDSRNRPLNPETLDRESSGYFLISAFTELPDGWRLVNEAEASAQFGDLRTAPSPRHVEVNVRLSVPERIVDDSAVLELSGPAGDYVLQWTPGLELPPFSDIIPFSLTNETPVIQLQLNQFSMLQSHDYGFFRVR